MTDQSKDDAKEIKLRWNAGEGVVVVSQPPEVTHVHALAVGPHLFVQWLEGR
mgnify:CR=1 FL=1